jgi:hypothetical protein
MWSNQNGVKKMSKSKRMKVASLFAGLLLCMVLMQTAFAAGNQNNFTVNFTNTGNMNNSSVTISPIITQTDELVAGNQNQFTANPTNADIMINSPITISPTITQTELATGNAIADNTTIENTTIENATNENTNTGNTIVDNTTAENTAVNSVSPSGYGTSLTAGSGTQLTVSFTNGGNETLNLTPKVVATPNSQNQINDSWITISPINATVAPGSVQNFVVEINVPRCTESGDYQATIAFTDDLVPNTTQYVNSTQLDVTVQPQPKIELQASSISDNVEAGKEYEYQMKIKNVAAEDITIDPKLSNYNSYPGYAQAFGNDAIEIFAPSTIKAGEVANLTMWVHVLENATGSYNGYIDMNVDGKINDGSNPQIGLSFSVWQQPAVPYVKTFNTTKNTPITIEVSTYKYDSTMGLRTSPIQENPMFELGLTCNSSPVNMTLVKSIESASPSIGNFYPIWAIENGNVYQNSGESYVETYTVPGAIGVWELTILPKNTNNFGYSITKGDSNPAIKGNVTTKNTTIGNETIE